MISIQNRHNMLFLHSNGQWTDDPGAARVFRNSAVALGYVQKHELCDVQLVVAFANNPETVTVEVGEPCQK